MFQWSPLGLVYVAASLSHPCLEHPWWFTLSFLESISSPIISCHSIPSIFSYRSSCVSHFGLQSYYPHPLRNSVSCYHVNHELCALTRVDICLSLSPISPLSLVSFHQSQYYFPSCFSEDPHCLIYHEPYSIDINSFIPKEWPRGRCNSLPTSILVQHLGSSRGSHYFSLNWLFHVRDPKTSWSNDIAYCTSGSWVCVRCFRPHERVAH